MEKSIGALWITNGKNGEFWKGNIEIEKEGKKEKINVIVFKNTYKKDNQPDFRIYKQKEKQEENYIPNDEENQFEIFSDDDLPF